MHPVPDRPDARARAHFAPHTNGLTWRPAPAGFSGARVWRGEAAGVPRVALKAWPPGTDPTHLEHIHAWMIRAEQLPFVPVVLRGADGSSVVTAGGRVWDCGRWVPGEPRLHPTAADAARAGEAVARLHDVWSAGARHGPCPGARARLRVLAENEPLLRAGPGALSPVSPHLDPLLRRAVGAVARRAPAIVAALEPWAQRAFALHPCVRDLHGEHVLFDGDRVSGIVDFGAAAVDHAGVDLARLLGDYAPAGDARFAAGLTAYRAARPAFDAPDEFVRALATAGAACSVLGWLVRLVVWREPVSDPARIRQRLTHLLARLDDGTGF